MRWAGLVFAVALLLSLVSSLAEKPENWQERLGVSLDEKSERVVQAKAKLAETLASVVPTIKGEQNIKTDDGRIVLCGDLFRQGKAYALVELTSGGGETDYRIGVGFAAWNGKKWEPRGLWKIAPIWRPEEWKESENEHFPISPVQKPFWTLEVGANQPPLAIIAGGIWRYWQEHFIARLDPAADALILLDQSKEVKPLVGYLRFTEDSGHRSTFVAWEFRIWTGQKLIPKAYWYEGMDKAEEYSLWKAATYDIEGRKSAEYLIVRNQDYGSYKITRNGERYASVTITPRNSPTASNESDDGAYFFEKLTGLPRKHFPPREWNPNAKRLEDIAKIAVTGPPEAMKKLSPRK